MNQNFIVDSSLFFRTHVKENIYSKLEIYRKFTVIFRNVNVGKHCEIIENNLNL